MIPNKTVLEDIVRTQRSLLSAGIDDPDLLLLGRLYLFYRLRGQASAGRPPLGSYLRSLASQCFWFLPNLVAMRRRSCDCLVFAPANHRNVRVGDEWVSKHMDALSSHLEKHEGRAVVRVESGIGPGRAPGPTRLNVSRVVALLSRLVPASREWALAQIIEQVARDSSELLSDRDPNPGGMARFIIEYVRKRAVYRFLLGSRGAKQCYFVVYYAQDHLAAAYWANRNGLPTFEYQHGVQNDYHPMYARVCEGQHSAPSSIPREFLLWDEVADKRFHRWADSVSGTALRSRVVGNHWYEYRRHLPPAVMPGHLREALQHAKRVVCVALQEWPATFNRNILSALQDLGSDCAVVVRSHPLNKAKNEEIRQTFEGLSLAAHLVFDSGQDSPLEALLDRCDMCITGFSTVGIEALHMGLVTVFTHPNAREGLTEYLAAERCLYADSEYDLKMALQNNLVPRNGSRQ